MDSKSELDKFDTELLRLLQENSRMKNTELAEKLEVTEGAIRKRISKLIASGVIEKFTIQMSEKSVGVRAVVEISIGGDVQSSKIRREIEDNIERGIEVIYELTGDVDLIVIFHTTSHDELMDSIEKLRQIKGIKSTSTHVVLKRTKLPNPLF